MNSCYVLVWLLLILVTLQKSVVDANKQKYVVYMGGKGQAEASSLTNYHRDILVDILGSQAAASEAIIFSYKHSFSGFSAWLTNVEAESIAKIQGVVSVFESKKLQVQTTRSWSYMGFNATDDPHYSHLVGGEEIIIGVLDTGIWPESLSFQEQGLKPVPARWKGACVNTGVTNKSQIIHCNKKLIGARYYGDEKNARDYNGHGTHTSSTAGGRLIEHENLFGLGGGNARGGLPGARIAMYKVCDDSGVCSEDAILAAFDDAIHDGVDLLSLSIGGPEVSYDKNSIAIGSFHAMEKGIIVSCAAGNEGPGPSTVGNTAPWILTAGASTIDRDFAVSVKFGNGKMVKATGLSLKNTAENIKMFSGLQAKSKSGSVNGALYCDTGEFDPNKVKGSVIVCLYPDIASRETVIVNLMDMGAAGVILGSDSRGNVIYHFGIPGGTVSMAVYNDILTYLNSTRNATVTIGSTKTVYPSIAPVVAGFSSRGPSLINPDILKPDFTAPGVNIIASWSPVSALYYEHHPNGGEVPVFAEYNIVSGTSMACPHVTGAAAFLKSVHPTWSPAAVKSALLTTAKFLDSSKSTIKDSDGTVATPFVTGAGEVSPLKASTPGLVYDIIADDYINYLCATGKYDIKKLKLITGRQNVTCAAKDAAQLNYPSVSIPDLTTRGSVNVSRTVTNVGGADAVYNVTVSSPSGVTITVTPPQLRFTSVGQKLSFLVKVQLNKKLRAQWVFGSFTWSDGSNEVRSPLAFK